MDTKNTYEAGKAHGKAEEKTKTIAEKATNAVQGAGVQVQGAAVGAFDAVKNATGLGKK